MKVRDITLNQNCGNISEQTILHKIQTRYKITKYTAYSCIIPVYQFHTVNARDVAKYVAKCLHVPSSIYDRLKQGVARGRGARGKKHKWRPFPVSEYLKDC